MTVTMILKSVLEFGMIVFTLWAVFHEDKFAAAEQRVLTYLRRRRFKVIRGYEQPTRVIRDR